MPRKPTKPSTEQQHVEVDIEIKRTAKTLDERYCTGAGGTAGVPSLPNLVGSKRPINDAQHLAHYRRADSEQESQGIRGAQHPLPYWGIGQNVVGKPA